MDKKKRKVLIGGIAVLAVIAFVATAVLLLSKRGENQVVAEPFNETVLKASESLDKIILDITFDPDGKTMEVHQKMFLQNTWGQGVEQVVLRTYANAFLSQETSPAAIEDLFDNTYFNGFSLGGLTIGEVTVENKPVVYTFEDSEKTIMVLPLERLWEEQETIEVELFYKVTIPNCAYRFGYVGNTYQLGNVFPTLAVFENGQWRKEEYYPIGDPFYTQCANYEVTLETPLDYEVASSAYGKPTKQENKQTYRYEGLALRDFAFVISNEMSVAQKKVEGVVLSALGQSKKNTAKLLEYGEKALVYYNQLFGNYPYQQLTLSQVNFPFGGMEYPGLVMVGISADTTQGNDFEWTVAHEVAHQWWYGVVGNDAYYQPWQDEALCEYSLLCYIEKYYGEEAKENAVTARIKTAMQVTVPQGVTPGSPISYFGDLSEYSLVVYRRGTMLFLTLEEAMGKEGVSHFLNEYYEEHAFKLATRNDFERSLYRASGQDWNAFLVEVLDTEYRY